jgi:RNA polymerase sigma-70 factor, ECF subfamily
VAAGAARRGAEQEAAEARLVGLLTRVAHGEVRRRAPRLDFSGPELDDIAEQAAADATLAVLRKLGEFLGRAASSPGRSGSRSSRSRRKVGRHFWRHPRAALDAEDWERLPDRFGVDAARQAEWRELVTAFRAAVDETLTDHQRRVFVALVLNGVPLDALAVQLGSTRNALYTTLFDARRKLREALVRARHPDLDVAART